MILRTAAVLASYDPKNDRWVTASHDVCNELVRVNPMHLAYWVESLRPVEGRLVKSLTLLCKNPDRPAIERALANVVLGEYTPGFRGGLGEAAEAFPMIGD